MRRIGVLVGFAESDRNLRCSSPHFGTASSGWGGRRALNIRIEYRWGAGDPTHMRAHAKELIGTSPDILVAESTPATASLQAETQTTPIVFSQASTPSAAVSSPALRDQVEISRVSPTMPNHGRQIA